MTTFTSARRPRPWALIIGLLVVLSLGFAALTPAAAQTTGVVTAGALNVRTGPGTNFVVIGSVVRGQQVTILERSGNWYRIASGRDRGWVSSRYVSTYYADRQPYQYRGRDIDIVQSRFGRANVFSGPAANYTLIGVLDNGVSVRVVSRGPSWTLVSKSGLGRGYVRSGFLVD